MKTRSLKQLSAVENVKTKINFLETIWNISHLRTCLENMALLLGSPAVARESQEPTSVSEYMPGPDTRPYISWGGRKGKYFNNFFNETVEINVETIAKWKDAFFFSNLKFFI